MSVEQIKLESDIEKGKDPILSLIEEFIKGENLSDEQKEEINDELIFLLEQFFEYRDLDEGFSEYKKKVLSTDSYDVEAQRETKLVRSINLSELIRAFKGDKKALLAGNHNDHYANSGRPTMDATNIALSEGKTEGPCKTIISFKTDNVEIYPVEVRPDDPRDQSHRVAHLKHIIGTIRPEDIEYVLLRFPMKTFPVHLMNSEELEINQNRLLKAGRGIKVEDDEEKLYFVYRGIDLNQKNKKPGEPLQVARRG